MAVFRVIHTIADPQPAVSVIIPSYNRRDLLRRALDSVRDQSLGAAQTIVVDDGSTDGSATMLADDYPGVECLRQAQGGVSAARNRGIRAAASEWIAFLDSDDAWQPHKLERQMAALDRNPGARVCHTGEIWIRHGHRVNQRAKHARRGGRIFRDCLPLCAMSPSSIVVHRAVFDDIGVFDESLPACEDYDLWLRITARYAVLYIDEPLVIKHGGHDDQLSRKYWGMDRFRITALENVLASADLDAEDREAARRMLVDKIRIYLAGARKRGKNVEANAYAAKLARHANTETAAAEPPHAAG